MAELHAAAFDGAARWSPQSFRDLLDAPATFLIERPRAFLFGRVTLDEAELLTLIVDPAHRGRGTGRALVQEFDAEARRRGATDAFLEVAADNAPARALYAATGWRQVGRRGGYYDGIDALILRKAL